MVSHVYKTINVRQFIIATLGIFVRQKVSGWLSLKRITGVNLSELGLLINMGSFNTSVDIILLFFDLTVDTTGIQSLMSDVNKDHTTTLILRVFVQQKVSGWLSLKQITGVNLSEQSICDSFFTNLLKLATPFQNSSFFRLSSSAVIEHSEPVKLVDFLDLVGF